MIFIFFFEVDCPFKPDVLLNTWMYFGRCRSVAGKKHSLMCYTVSMLRVARGDGPIDTSAESSPLCCGWILFVLQGGA